MNRARNFALCLGLALCLTGCFGPSPDVHFYVLASPQEESALIGGEGVSPRTGPRVGIMPVNLPDYLRQSQMVLRQGHQVDIRMEDYHRWGEDLALGIARVLSVSMTNGMAGIQGVALPLRPGVALDYRVQLEIRRFEGSPGGTAALEALWGIRQEGKPLREGHFFAEIPAGHDIPALVEAQSRLLNQLGEEIASGVKAVYNP